MQKILLMTIAVILPISTLIGQPQTLSEEEIHKRNKEYLAKTGIAIPEAGEIRVVSAISIINRKNIANNKSAIVVQAMKKFLLMHAQQEQNGYVKNSDTRAKELMELKHIAPYHQKKYRSILAQESTHIRSAIGELKMAYTFVGVPEVEMDLNIGVAPYGAYKQKKYGDDADGWDGAVQFFENKNIGSCAFTEHNRKLARGGVEIIKELMSYDVHGKPTILLVQGSKETGFVYKLKWYDTIFNRELECANAKFSPELRTKVIELANRIESYQ